MQHQLPSHSTWHSGNAGGGKLCYFRGIPSVLSLCGFPSLLALADTGKGWGLQKHTPTSVFGGGHRNISSYYCIIIVLH